VDQLASVYLEDGEEVVVNLDMSTWELDFDVDTSTGWQSVALMFFRMPYRPSCFWWSGLVMFVKLCVVLVSVMFDSLPIQYLLVCVIVVCYYTLFGRVQL